MCLDATCVCLSVWRTVRLEARSNCQVCFGAGSRGRDVVRKFPRTEKPFEEFNAGVKFRSTRLKKLPMAKYFSNVSNATEVVDWAYSEFSKGGSIHGALLQMPIVEDGPGTRYPVVLNSKDAYSERKGSKTAPRWRIEKCHTASSTGRPQEDWRNRGANSHAACLKWTARKDYLSVSLARGA